MLKPRRRRGRVRRYQAAQEGRQRSGEDRRDVGRVGTDQLILTNRRTSIGSANGESAPNTSWSQDMNASVTV